MRFSLDLNEELTCNKCSKKDTCPLKNVVPPYKKVKITITVNARKLGHTKDRAFLKILEKLKKLKS